jgi:hypothetical protein
MRMSVPATTFFNVERLRRYDGPQYFLAGGFLVGLLIFFAWLSTRPDTGKHSLHARGNGVVSAEAMAEPGRSVLGDITGGARGPAPGLDSQDEQFSSEGEVEIDADAAAQAATEGALAPDPSFDQAAAQESDAMAVGEDIGSRPYPEEGALTDSLLDAPAPQAEPGAPPAPPSTAPGGGPLRPWFVEVEDANGQVQMLQLNAESPEHAMAILRDFRGNPRVLRGPSPDPLP